MYLENEQFGFFMVSYHESNGTVHVNGSWGFFLWVDSSLCWLEFVLKNYTKKYLERKRERYSSYFQTNFCISEIPSVCGSQSLGR